MTSSHQRVFIVKHLNWVPHIPTAEHKTQRVQLAKDLLKTIAPRVETHGAILQLVTKVSFIYPLILKPFGYKKGKTDLEDILN
jgi:hypothetical protein